MKKFLSVFFLLGIFSACSMDLSDSTQVRSDSLTMPLSEAELIKVHILEDPTGRVAQDYVNYINSREISKNTALNEKTLVLPAQGFSSASGNIQTLAKVSESSRKVSVIVNSSLYPAIQNRLGRYMYDLEIDGYEVLLHVANGNGQPSALKNLIRQDFQNNGIRGVFLIGKFPVAWYEINDYNRGNIVSFPMDLYYTDLDGSWSDEDGNGIFDKHSGDVAPEIWMGRLCAVGMSDNNQTESEQINRYLDKNHAYRVGQNRLANRALAMINQDWKNNGFDDYFSTLYQNKTIIKDPEETVSSDRYRTEISTASSSGYESLLLASHSSWSLHSFNTGSFFHVNEIKKIESKVEFYNLFACSAARFTEADNLAGWYVLQQNFGLNVIGSTKSGGMLDFQYYYKPLSEGNSLGDSFLSWFQNIPLDSVYRQSWHYGMVMMGDPTLRLSRYQSVIADNYTNHVVPSLYLRGTLNQWGITPMNLVAPNVWQTVVHFEDGTNESFKFDVYGDWKLNFGDTDADGSVEEDGDNISVTQGSGYYRISFNDKTQTYRVEKVNLRGKVVLHLSIKTADDFRNLEGEWISLEKGNVVIAKSQIHSKLDEKNALLTFEDLPLGHYHIDWNCLKNTHLFSLTTSFDVTEKNVWSNQNLNVSVAGKRGEGSATFGFVMSGAGVETELIDEIAELYLNGKFYSSNRVTGYAYGSGDALLSVSELQPGNYRLSLKASKGGLYYFVSHEFKIDSSYTYENATLTVSSRPHESLYKEILFQGETSALKMKLVADHLWQCKANVSSNERFHFQTINETTIINFGDFNADGKVEQNGTYIFLDKDSIVLFDDLKGTYTIQEKQLKTQAKIDFYGYKGSREGLIGKTASLYSNETYLQEVPVQDLQNSDFPFTLIKNIGSGKYRLTLNFKTGNTNYSGTMNFTINEKNTNFHGSLFVSRSVF